jgi:glucose dehydrogenase
MAHYPKDLDDDEIFIFDTLENIPLTKVIEIFNSNSDFVFINSKSGEVIETNKEDGFVKLESGIEDPFIVFYPSDFESHFTFKKYINWKGEQ